MMRAVFFLLLVLASCSPLSLPAQVTTGDVLMTEKSATGKLVEKWITKTPNKVIGWNGSGVLGPITLSGGAWGSITGTLSAQTDLQTALNNKQAQSDNLNTLSAGFSFLGGMIMWDGAAFIKQTSALSTGFGGTGISSYAMGDTLYAGSGGLEKLAGNTTTAKRFLTQTGNGTVSAAPDWGVILAADVPTLNQNTTGTAAGLSTTLAVANGGTGQTTFTNGQILIGNSTNNSLTKATLTAGSGISITNGNGSITIAATGGGVTTGANTFTALQTITQASANAGVIASTGYSLTGSNATSMIDLGGTWNTSGSPTGFKLSITNTASGSSSRIFDLLRGSTSLFYVRPDGTTHVGDIGGSGVVFSSGFIQGAYGGSSTSRPMIQMAGGSGSSVIVSVGQITSNDCFGIGGPGNAANANLFGVFASNTAYAFTVGPTRKDYFGSYSGSGHTFNLLGGAGSSLSTGGAGGVVNITGGAAAGSGNNNGGNVIISGGAKTGSGVAGGVAIGSSGTTHSRIKSGVAVLVAGSVTVSDTDVIESGTASANSRIFVTRMIDGGTVGTYSITRINGTSFTITGLGTDTSTVSWWMVNP